MGAAEKIVLWDSWLRGESPKAIWRAFGKPSSLLLPAGPPMLRRPVETTAHSGQSNRSRECPLLAGWVMGVADHQSHAGGDGERWGHSCGDSLAFVTRLERSPEIAIGFGTDASLIDAVSFKHADVVIFQPYGTSTIV